MLSFKPTFSLSSFTFSKSLLSSSSLSAIRVVSSLRLLIFLPAILIPACASYITIYNEIRKVIPGLLILISSFALVKELILIRVPKEMTWFNQYFSFWYPIFLYSTMSCFPTSIFPRIFLLFFFLYALVPSTYISIYSLAYPLE